ncbi:autotransporter outer membrane beta-barrel domain-containing protein, partial [Achromobacter sp. DH1f]|uniref:autotransporter outer membrane beta-barrel domain-containing protein n=1 Tax=Achromobacter sp. DH1f TaxID=1397275 RepID=UPI00046A335B
MRIALNPIMVGLLAASLPTLPLPARAAEPLSYAVPAAGLQVSNGDAPYHGSGVNFVVGTAGDPATKDMMGVRAVAGGKIELTNNSSVTTLGDGQAAHALAATGVGSEITFTDSRASTRGDLSNGANATSGGSIVIRGGSVATTGVSAVGLWAQDARSSITTTNVDITTRGDDAAGVQANNGATITLNGGSVTALGGYASSGVEVAGLNSQVSLNHTVVKGGGDHYGARMSGGRLDMEGGSLTGGIALYMGADAGGASNLAYLNNAALISTGSGAALDMNAAYSFVSLSNSSISAQAADGGGIWLPSKDTQLIANNFDITSNLTGIDNRLGNVSLNTGTITTQGAGGHGLYVSREYGSAALIDATRVTIETQGNRASGAEVRLGDLNSRDAAEIRLRNSRITTRGNNAPGLLARGAYSTLSATDTVVTTSGVNSSGLVTSEGATTTLDNVRMTAQGAGAVGIWSTRESDSQLNTVTVRNGTEINTQDGAALRANGGYHVFEISDATLTGRAGGSLDNGVLLHTDFLRVTSGGVSTDTNTVRVTVNAVRSRLTGDVVARDGSAFVSLEDGSMLTGALQERDTGHVDGMKLDATSTWNVRGDSTLELLDNSGTVAFMAPTGGVGFKTITVSNYAGGGTLVLNTQLGDDTSATDKLVINRGTTTGNTSLRVLNAGGTGAQTQTGIRVVQTINGATTTADAFRLDAGSSGYRASAQTLALNGYEYSLVRGGNGGAASDWYLTSDYTGFVPPVPVVPISPTDPAVPISPADPVSPVVPPPTPLRIVRNVSPESGAYLGNRLASAQFFNHGRHDRTPAYTNGASAPYAAGDGGGDAADDGSVNSGRGLWTRVQGRQDSGLRLSQGRVAIDSDSAILQLGGDLVKAPLGQGGVLYAGLMGGHGDARTTSTST